LASAAAAAYALGFLILEDLVVKSGINGPAAGSCYREDVAMGLPSSQRSVQQLVEDHYAALYRYAYRLSGAAAEAEDLTQETFCKAQVQWAQLRDHERAKAWLFSILRNAYLHRARSQRQHREISLDCAGDLPEPLADPLPEVEPERLQQALAELSEVFRTPVILYYFEDFSYRDIAEQMELPIGTVMSRLARAKAYLRARLLQPQTAVAAQGQRRAKDGL
jgi:RNA polymerase sigma-70 factor, ECF subfamily